jgi:hypothetical protein
MKKIALLSLIFIYGWSAAQDSETILYVNRNGEEVKEKKADFLIQRLKSASGSWEINIYEIFGPRLASMQSKDENGSIKNGSYTTYQNGEIDSTGFFVNNKRDSI